MDRSLPPLMTALPFVASIAIPGALALSATSLPTRDLSPWSGSYQRAYEDAYSDNMPLSETARAALTAATLLLFREAGPEVVVAGDWLFTTEEMRAPDNDSGFAEALTRTRDTLAAQGITLIPVIVPDKARVYADLLPRARDAAIETRYDRALTVLSEMGFAAVDLDAALRDARSDGATFMRTDTHWSPLGAATAAQMLAEATGLRGTGTGAFETTYGAPLPFDGDLMPFVDTGPFAAHVGPTPETLSTPVTVAAETGLGLFDEVAIDAVLIGTSFSARTEFNFNGFLQEATGLSIVNLAQEGRGPFAPMRDALANGVLIDLTPSIVFWEIPERYIHPRSLP